MSKNFFGQCKHERLTDVKEYGYQYCTDCNKAFAPPKKVCNHQWEKEDEIGDGTIFNNNPHTFIYIYCCMKCGKRVKVTTRDKDNWARAFA